MVGVEDIEHGAVALEEVGEEPDGLLVHRAPERGELGEDLLALLVVRVEAADVEPLAGELGGERAAPSRRCSIRRAWAVSDLGVVRACPRPPARRSSSSGIDDQRK